VLPKHHSDYTIDGVPGHIVNQCSTDGYVIVDSIAVCGHRSWLAGLFEALPANDRMPDAALDALRGRLAAGEISPEEFEETKKALGA